MGRLFQCLRAVAFWSEDQFNWLFRNPVFPAQILLMLMASWGLLGAELGVERLFWSEFWSVQLGCGLAVGMLFGVVLLVWYLLDRPQRAVVVASRHGRPSLFPSKSNRRVRRLGSYMLWALPVLLSVMILGKALVIALAVERNNPPMDLGVYLSGRHYLLFGILGCLQHGAGVVALRPRRAIEDSRSHRQWSPFIDQPGFKSGRVPKGDIPLHAVSACIVCVGLLFLAMAMIGLTILNSSSPGRVADKPVVIVSLVCILITI